MLLPLSPPIPNPVTPSPTSCTTRQKNAKENHGESKHRTVIAPFMLRQKIPVLVSASNFLVSACNFSVTYFLPMWFQVVTLESATTADLHLMPNSVSMSTGSVIAEWMMHRTGRCKKINLIFGIFPFVGTVLISLMRRTPDRSNLG
ncbi:hypothetical protein B0H11DRAFT_782964 [Mycena galericulata]|nr:hypothetical protein B0H11DRAFT_782964 [Mycena galericulata]